MLLFYLSLPILASFLFFQADAVVNPCDSITCKYEGKCHFDTAKNEAICECKFPTGGDRCELELGGCTNCDRRGKQVLVLMDKPALTFDDAKKACEDQGLTMFSPKTKALQTLFMSYRLKLQQEKKSPGPNVAYWIGIKRESLYAKYKWVDGSVVGTDRTTLSWAAGQPKEADGPCAIIRTQDAPFFSWLTHLCIRTAADTFTIYPACIGTFEFLPE